MIINPVAIVCRINNQGQLKIKGQINRLGVPTQSRLRLYDKFSGAMVADVTADKNGNYEIIGLSKSKYYIVSHDSIDQFNAIIQDNVVPK